MNYMPLVCMMMLSVCVTYAADRDYAVNDSKRPQKSSKRTQKSSDQKNIVQRLLAARTDTENVDSIISANFDKDPIDDTAFHEILTQASGLITMSAQNNMLKNPQPVQHFCITKLDVSNGNIQALPIGEWVNALRNLRSLKAAYNKIYSIATDFDMQHGLCVNVQTQWRSDSLQELDLSYNALPEFDLNILNNAPNLTKADFSHNNIAQVEICKNVGHRQLCTVQLHHNQLDYAAQKQLLQCNVHDTKEVENNEGRGCVFGMIGGGGLALGSVTGITRVAMPYLPIAATICLGVGTGLFCMLLVPYIGYKIGTCCTPEGRRTYAPFIFEFDSAKKLSDDTVVDLDEL